jgi:hypothetical protein
MRFEFLFVRASRLQLQNDTINFTTEESNISNIIQACYLKNESIQSKGSQAQSLHGSNAIVNLFQLSF